MHRRRSKQSKSKPSPTWNIQITAVRKEIDKTSRQLLVSAAIQMAIDKLKDEAEAKLAKLKGDQSRQARAQRKELKAELEALKTYEHRYAHLVRLSKNGLFRTCHL